MPTSAIIDLIDPARAWDTTALAFGAGSRLAREDWLMTTTRGIATLAIVLALIAFAAIASVARADCAAVDPLTLLPPDGTCDWARDGEPQTAYTLEELAVIIDGGAFLFEEYGFVAAAFQNYTGDAGGTPSAATLGLYNQGSAANAEALYNDPDSGYGDPVPGWTGSGAARYRVAFGYLTLDLWEECFYASLIFVAGGELALPDAICLGETVVNGIQQVTPAGTTTWGDLKEAYRFER
jgi:hypothetical protein